MCRDLGDGVVPPAGAYVVSSLLPQPGQRAADIAFPDRSDSHDGLLCDPVLALGVHEVPTKPRSRIRRAGGEPPRGQYSPGETVRVTKGISLWSRQSPLR